MRRSNQLFVGLAVLATLFGFTLVDMLVHQSGSNQRLKAMATQVSQLELTDLSLFTEARYTRHLSQSDRHAPFQDHPLSFEHFPSGSLIVPPRGAK